MPPFKMSSGMLDLSLPQLAPERQSHTTSLDGFLYRPVLPIENYSTDKKASDTHATYYF
jgi:hypothetical protein